MNAKQLGIIGAILVLCIVGVFLVNSKNRRTVQRPANVLGQKVFPELSEDGALNRVGRIVIRDARSSVTLEKSGDGSTWTVSDRGGFPADFDRIRGFLQDIWELEITEAQVVGASKLGRLELLEPPSEPTTPPADEGEGEEEEGGEGDGTGTLVVVSDSEGKEITRFVLGKTFEGGAATPSPFGFSMGGSQGRFVKTPAGGDNVWMVSEALSDSRPDPADWLDKEFIRVSKPQSVAFTAAEPADSWTLERTEETGDFTLADAAEGEELDTAKAGPIKNILASPSFKDVVADPSDEATGLDDPERFVIDTFEGFHYEVQVGDKTADGDFHMTFTVSADFPTEYVPEEDDESAKPSDGEGEGSDAAEGAEEGAADEEEAAKKAEEERRKKKEAFEKEVERKQEKLEKEQALAGKVYVVNRWSLDSVLKKRAELLKEPETEGDEEGVDPAAAATAPVAIPPRTREPITAVTPPIEVPIPPREEDPSAGEEEEAPQPGDADASGEAGEADDPDDGASAPAADGDAEAEPAEAGAESAN